MYTCIKYKFTCNEAKKIFDFIGSYNDSQILKYILNHYVFTGNIVTYKSVNIKTITFLQNYTNKK